MTDSLLNFYEFQRAGPWGTVDEGEGGGGKKKKTKAKQVLNEVKKEHGWFYRRSENCRRAAHQTGKGGEGNRRMKNYNRVLSKGRARRVRKEVNQYPG